MIIAMILLRFRREQLCRFHLASILSDFALLGGNAFFLKIDAIFKGTKKHATNLSNFQKC